jgi:hypothetical protein
MNQSHLKILKLEIGLNHFRKNGYADYFCLDEVNIMENVTEIPLLSPKGTFPATVVKVIDDYKLVMNRGEQNGIREGQRMMVYRIDDEEILDPHTGESLGFLELVRGTGRIIFVQDKISIIETDQKKTYRKRIENSSLGLRSYKSEVVESDELKPFDNAQVGDLVKPI